MGEAVRERETEKERKRKASMYVYMLSEKGNSFYIVKGPPRE